MIRSLGTRVKNNSSNFAAVTFETRALPTLPRCYRRSFTLITRTASCSRQLP